MVRGLQVTISGTALSERIAERIRTHESKAASLEERLSRRAGDLPFDIRAGDGLETFGELQAAHELHRDRAAQLTVLRDGVKGDETYVLTMADLQAADLAQSFSSDDGNRRDADVVEQCSSAPVDGLRVTISGARLEKMLEEGVQVHRDRAEWWKHEAARTPEEQTEDEPLLPTHMCENEAERRVWYAEVLEFLRDHIEPAATYRLGRADLEFGELLPDKPGWMEQEEYEERTAAGFHLGRIAKRIAV